ncbi:Gfo/Idh/MocA family oxidoreductase [Acidobacteria bacterium AH-259-O06]|nr:Gfo/Idh/MocA family oxidoreductase [Acidobacteria bacterium AH-259-O06]
MQDSNRRDFLKLSAWLTGVCFAAPAIARSRRSPNDRLRVAVVGLRQRGWRLAQNIHELGADNVELAGLCDVDETVLNRAVDHCEKLSGQKVRTFIDLRDVLDDQSIDAVFLATPDHWHALGTIWACQAGKDVYVEKPACHNIFEGRKMVEAARKYNRIVQHGTQSRSNSTMREGIEKLREGVIGEIYMARGICYKWRESIGRVKEEPVPPGVHYDLWVGPAPMKPFSKLRFHYNWHFLWDYGTGEIGNQGAHQLDIARWGLGLDSHPGKIQSMGGLFVHKDDQQTPNTQIASYRYEGRNLLLQFDVRHWITNRDACIGDTFASRGERNNVGVIFYGSEGFMLMPGYTSYYTFLGQKRKPGPKAVSPGKSPGQFASHCQLYSGRAQSQALRPDSRH